MARPIPRPAKPRVAEDPIAEIFESWRLWLLGALIGAVLSWAIYVISPPDYRARATVVVDNNLEEAWKFFPDRQLFQFLQRETERLELQAWSDSVMQTVASSTDQMDIETLRSGTLKLSQPADGGWHFYADSPDKDSAQLLASSWAQAFVDTARAATQASPDLQTVRTELDSVLLSANPDEQEIQRIAQQIAELAEQTKGISPFVELYVSEGENLSVERSVSLATYLLAGSIVGALLLPFWVVLHPMSSGFRELDA